MYKIKSTKIQQLNMNSIGDQEKITAMQLRGEVKWYKLEKIDEEGFRWEEAINIEEQRILIFQRQKLEKQQPYEGEQISSQEQDSFFQDGGEMSLSDEIFGEYQPVAVTGKKKNKLKAPMFKNKHKTKTILKRRIKTMGLKKQNILEQQLRENEPKKYDFFDQKVQEEKISLFDLRKIQKNINKSKQTEAILIDSVISTIQVKRQKHFLVKLCNLDEVLISEVKMKSYFPNKLTEYYEKLIESMTTVRMLSL